MKEFLESFVHAMRGIGVGIIEQRNLKVQITVAVIAIVAGFYAGVTPIEWCIILLCIGLVISLELVNSAIEDLVDLVTLEKRPLAGKIKDIAAGGVLFFSFVSVIIGLILFRKYLIA